MNGHFKVAEFLLEQGADVTVINKVRDSYKLHYLLTYCTICHQYTQ